MDIAANQMASYLVEWYREEAWQERSFVRAFAQLRQGAEFIADDGTSATVLMTLAVPTDDAIFCVLAAATAEGVVNACSRLGLPPQRVTAALAMIRTHDTPQAV